MTPQNRRVEKYFTPHNRFFHEELDCWTLCQKFCLNSKTVTDLSRYLERFILSSLEDKTGQILPLFQKWFTYQLLPSGAYRFFLKKEFYPLFKKKFYTYLRSEAKRLDEKCLVCDLKYFIRSYKAGSKVTIKQLKTYILKNAFDLTYHANGQKIPVFQMDGQSLTIQKAGISTFIKTHLTQLEQMGFDRLELQLSNCNFHKDVTAIGVKKIAQMLDITDTEKLATFVQQPTCHCVEVLVMKKGEPQLQPLVFEKNGYVLLVADLMPYFTALFYEKLKSMGASEKKLNLFAGLTPVTPYQQEMLPLKELFQILSLPAKAELSAEIYATFSNETYQDLKTNKKEKVFVDTFFHNKIRIYIKNKEAMLALIKKHRSFFEEKGVCPNRIDSVLGVRFIRPWQKEYIALSELSSYLKVSRKNEALLRDICLENGVQNSLNSDNKNEQPLFFLTKRENKGRLLYALDTKGIKTFVTSYATLLDLNPLVVESILQKKPIEPVCKGYLNLYQLWDVLGRGEKEQFKKLSHFIYDIYQNAFFEKQNSSATCIKAPIFRPMKAKNKKVTLYIDADAVPYFIQTYEKELISFKFKKERLKKALAQMQTIIASHQFLPPHFNQRQNMR